MMRKNLFLMVVVVAIALGTVAYLQHASGSNVPPGAKEYVRVYTGSHAVYKGFVTFYEFLAGNRLWYGDAVTGKKEVIGGGTVIAETLFVSPTRPKKAMARVWVYGGGLELESAEASWLAQGAPILRYMNAKTGKTVTVSDGMTIVERYGQRYGAGKAMAHVCVSNDGLQVRSVDVQWYDLSDSGTLQYIATTGQLVVVYGGTNAIKRL